ncbi:MAG TPA: helix-turn-helix domain-containing protein [Stellaceae bacterium]|jgi:AraC-like DNA-binding protein
MLPIASCRHELVRTAGFGREVRFAYSQDTGGQPFAATIRRLTAPEGRFTDLHMTAAGLGRTARQCRADGIDDIALTVTLDGGGAGWFGDPNRTTRLGSGLLRVRDQSSPYFLHWTGAENRTLHVDLPRARLDRKTLGRVVAAAGTLLPRQGLAPMLVAQMRALAEAAPDLDPAARSAGLGAVIELATTVLRLEFGSEPAESEACADGMLVAAQALICRRFGTVDLSPEEIARRLGCSRAHLYRLFARHGLTVAGYLREIRLQRCRAALATAGPHETVADIAFRCGFDNPVHFARLFRERFGMRPRDARAAGEVGRFRSGREFETQTPEN